MKRKTKITALTGAMTLLLGGTAFAGRSWAEGRGYNSDQFKCATPIGQGPTVGTARLARDAFYGDRNLSIHRNSIRIAGAGGVQPGTLPPGDGLQMVYPERGNSSIYALVTDDSDRGTVSLQATSPATVVSYDSALRAFAPNGSVICFLGFS